MMRSRPRSTRARGQLVVLLLAFSVAAPAAVASAKVVRTAHRTHASNRAFTTGQRARAPHLSVSGYTLNWSAVANTNTYVLVRKVRHEADQYSTVHGTSITPAPLPGTTVRYSVRSAAFGSAWALGRSITYAAAEAAATNPPAGPTAALGHGESEPPTTPPLGSAPPEAPSSPPLGGGEVGAPGAPAPNFQPGLNSGTNMHEDLQGARLLGAKVVRVGWSIATTPAEMQPTIAGYASQGIRVQPLAEFYERVPSPTEAQNLASWARVYGPGGTFWAARSDGQLAIQAIEFGNETASYGQYNDRPGDPSFLARAKSYALRFREAAQAISQTGSNVGLLAQDEDQSGDWMNGMYSAVPQLSKYVAGWTIHPYGGEQYNRERLDALIAQTAAHGASTIPIDITEWGVSTDNGSCVNANEGFNLCMTYQEAAQTLNSTVSWIRALLGERLGDFFLYQVRDQKPAGKTSNCQDYYGLLQHELQPKGAYTTAAQTLLSSTVDPSP